MPQLSVSLPLCTALNNPGTCNAHTLRGTHIVENDGMERWRGCNLNDDDDYTHIKIIMDAEEHH